MPSPGPRDAGAPRSGMSRRQPWPSRSRRASADTHSASVAHHAITSGSCSYALHHRSVLDGLGHQQRDDGRAVPEPHRPARRSWSSASTALERRRKQRVAACAAARAVAERHRPGSMACEARPLARHLAVRRDASVNVSASRRTIAGVSGEHRPADDLARLRGRRPATRRARGRRSCAAPRFPPHPGRRCRSTVRGHRTDLAGTRVSHLEGHMATFVILGNWTGAGGQELRGDAPARAKAKPGGQPLRRWAAGSSGRHLLDTGGSYDSFVRGRSAGRRDAHGRSPRRARRRGERAHGHDARLRDLGDGRSIDHDGQRGWGPTTRSADGQWASVAVREPRCLPFTCVERPANRQHLVVTQCSPQTPSTGR